MQSILPTAAGRSNQETTKGQPVDMSPWWSKGRTKCPVPQLPPGTKERKGLEGGCYSVLVDPELKQGIIFEKKQEWGGAW